MWDQLNVRLCWKHPDQTGKVKVHHLSSACLDLIMGEKKATPGGFWYPRER